jgi:hypothetical protein
MYVLCVRVGYDVCTRKIFLIGYTPDLLTIIHMSF